MPAEPKLNNPCTPNLDSTLMLKLLVLPIESGVVMALKCGCLIPT
jgi:hypothetical protein